jgi:Fe-S-cluster-containing dehydrogenase component
MAQKTLTATVVVDLKRCLGCRSCELACAKAHAGYDDIVEAVLADAALVPRVHVVAAEGCAVPVQCQHCEDAPCVAVCPTGALYRDEDGEVRAAPARCIGCKACLLVCPFGAAHWDPHARTVVRCDLCGDLIEEGEVPYCVAACPTHGRRVVRVEDVAARKRADSARRTIRVMRAEQEGDDAEG